MLTDARDQMMEKLKSMKHQQESDSQLHLQELAESKERLLADLEQATAENQVSWCY